MPNPTADRPGTLYIGRIGLRDDEHEPRLIDWRAPAAHPFYAATPRDPNGLIRRRHIYTRNRTVTGVDDEVFDLDRLSEPDRRSLSGEAMLIASITSRRTGRMSDVVATIQAEQDRVIRSALQGVLVVQGGPGTGKTVAALHRAAYLLYTHRRTLERRGVLVIGPNATFLRYISQVLPSLGETDVVLSSIAELFPGVKAAPDDDPEAAVVKGDVTMVNVLRRAVRNLQQVPPGDLEITADGVTMTVPNQVVLRARDRARGLRKPHNAARKLFITDLLGALAAAEARALGRELDPEDVPYARARLWDEPPVRAALDALWPFLTPQRLVAGLLAEEGALRRAAPGLPAAERSALLRPGHPDAWTVADVPLLDEAAQLLGTDDTADKRRRRAAGPGAPRRGAIRPRGPRDHPGGERGLRGLDQARRSRRRQHAGRLEPRPGPAAHHGRTGLGRPLLGLRPRDRGRGAGAVRDGLADGHAPDPDPVDDRGRRRGAAGERGRRPLLGADARPVREGPLARGAAHRQLPHPDRDHGPGRRRAGRGRPRREPARVRPRGGRGAARGPGSRRRPRRGEGRARRDGCHGRRRLAVIAPGNRIAELAQALPAAVPGDRAEVLDSPVALLTVGQAKGLEFDRVVLADPAGILDQSPAGGHDLYVAITRATHRLTIVHDAPLPATLHRLTEPPPLTPPPLTPPPLTPRTLPCPRAVPWTMT